MHKVAILIGGNEETVFIKNGANLLHALSENGYSLSGSCGGRGICNKCQVRLISGTVDVPVVKGYFKSCLYYVKDSLIIGLENITGKGVSTFSQIDYKINAREGFGIAVDIGTTTVIVYLLNFSNGQIIDKTSQLNTQSAYGADVINRINASGSGHLSHLHILIVEQINSIIKELTTKNSIDKIQDITISGNTTMLHLLKGTDPSPMGVYPFTPVFVDTQRLGKESMLSADATVLLPSTSAYIGSDIVAGVLSSGLINNKENNIIIDIGTNGEMVLSIKGRLLACATAAGPAFEGANIEMGVGGIAGAIDHVWLDNQRINFSTIEQQPAVGICGSGLVDAIAVMLDTGVIDENGTFDMGVEHTLKNQIKSDKFYIDDTVYISQKDIREFQLAKSAIISGILSLIGAENININDIDNVYLAGGFGFYLDINNAIHIGLLPKEFNDKITNIGNASGQGVIMCALNDVYLEECQKIARDIDIVELATNAKFMEYFIDNMSFNGG